MRSWPFGMGCVKDARWPSRTLQDFTDCTSEDRNSTTIEKNFSILEGVAEALKVCESILIPRYTICWDGSKVDLSKFTTIPSSWHKLRSWSLAQQTSSREDARISQLSRYQSIRTPNQWRNPETGAITQKRWNRHKEGWANGLGAIVNLLICRQATLPRKKGDNWPCRPPFRPFAGDLQTNLGHDQINFRLVA